MKLKFKITLICILAIFTAVIISDVIIVSYYAKKNNEEVMVSCKEQFFDTAKSYESEFNRLGREDYRDIFADTYLKKMQNEYVICINPETDKEIYNHTVFSAKEIERICDVESLQERSELNEGISYGVAKTQWKSREIIICGRSVGGINVYQVFDVTYVKEEIKNLLLSMVIVSFVVILIVIVLVWTLLKKAFLPLQKLSESAKKIAGGNYSERVSVSNKDEIGELGEQFNVMADAVEERIAKLLEEERKKNVFMGNLTHELRTPLTAIYGYAQTMRAVKLTKEEEEMALKYVEKESLRLSRLSDKMLQLMGLKEGGSIEKRQIKIKSIFKDSVNACSSYIQSKNIIIEMSVGDEYLIGDKDLMTEAIINLLSNAIRASAENGRVKLYVEDKEIVIEDEGAGMEKEEVDKILEPFYRIDKSRSRKEGGAGLGLSLVREILLKHNMEFKIDSKLGVGTRIIITYE